MKAALQEAEEAEGEENGVKKVRDAKGREILSEAEKAQKDERDRKRAAEVDYSFRLHWSKYSRWTQKAAMRKERVQKLVDNLERKLGIFTESATGPDDMDVTRSWRTISELEAE